MFKRSNEIYQTLSTGMIIFLHFSLLTHCEHCGKKEMGVLIINTPIPFVEEIFCLIMCLQDVQEKIGL
jgi:hypothetical protein